ncbi:hypothetical protein [Dipodfec virus UA23Rod_1392]|uniref:Uncharacterized protein n=1 Tax=Dipodfec virus UA23Rod_1392 TaxID=2929332 RepID=A0A976N1P6_9VIRU|nr:hypothetical protein [Dipodfec virus UA23Rod_1392]
MLEGVDFSPYITAFIFVLFSIINMVYTVKHGKSLDKEFLSMVKTLTPEKLAEERQKKPDAYTQSFSPLVKQYRFDSVTGELVEQEDMLDVDKLVASYVDVALDKLKEKLLPPIDITDKLKGDISVVEGDISSVCAGLDVLEEWRDKLGLDASVPVTTVYEKMEVERSKLLEQSRAAEKAKLEADAAAATHQRIVALQQELAKLQADKPQGGDTDA